MPIDPRDVAFLSLALLVDYGRTYAQVKTERAEKLRTASEVIAEALARANGATCPKGQSTANAQEATSDHGSTSAHETKNGQESGAGEGRASQPTSTDRDDDTRAHATEDTATEEPEAGTSPTDEPSTATDEPGADESATAQDAPVSEASTGDPVLDSDADEEGRGAPIEDSLRRPTPPTPDPADADNAPQPTRLAEILTPICDVADHAAIASPGASTSPGPQPIRLAETIARALAPLHPLGTPATPPPPLNLFALAPRPDYALAQRLVFADAASRVTARALVANRNNLAASRADTDNLRRDLAAHQAELAALRVENDTLRAENLALRHLEAEVDRLAQRVDTTVALVRTRIASRPSLPLAAPTPTLPSSLFAEPRDRLDLTVLHSVSAPHALTPPAGAPPHGPAPPHAHAQAPPPPPPQPTRASPSRKRSRRPALASLALLSLLDTPPLPAT